MSSRNGLIFLISSIILVLMCIVGLIGVYYFDWFKPTKSNYSLYTTTGDQDARFVIKDEQLGTTTTAGDGEQNVAPTENYVSKTDINVAGDNYSFYEATSTTNQPEVAVTENVAQQQEQHSVDQRQNSTSENVRVANNQNKKEVVVSSTVKQNYDNAQNGNNIPQANVASTNNRSVATNSSAKSIQSDNKQNSAATSVQPRVANKTTTNPVKPQTQTAFKKSVPTGKDGSPVNVSFTFDKNRDFHSYGQYISADEYKYRLAIINNLKIKTVVIDAVSEGNGISQEYYKVAYNEKMIPAKILDEITTSKEFRSLIPQKYLEIENKFAKFPKDGKVSFNNNDIKDLLILWSQGKLTPTQKAWSVNARL